jgi:hypothetical protein
MKKITFLFVILFVLSFGAMAQNIEKDIIGTWKMVDIKVCDATGKPAKMNAKLKKELAEGKTMFLGDDERMVLEFKDGKMNTIPSETEPEKYTISGKSVSTKSGGKVYANIVNGKLEMATTPAQNGMMVCVFEKQN